MNPLGTRARSEDLARLLDGAAWTAASAPYAGVAARLQGLGADLSVTVVPRAEFRSALRTRLVAVASVQAVNAETAATPTKGRALESAVSWSQSKRAQRGIGVAAGAMASVVAVAGVAVAGSQSLPGDPFYSVKRGGEALQLRTADGNVAKGSKHLAFAAERLKEVRKLSLGRDAAYAGSVQGPVAFGGSASARIAEALAAMDSETRSGSDLLTAAYRDTNSDAPLEILSQFAGRQTADLTALLSSLPTASRPRAEDSLALVSGVAVQASQLLAVGVCTGQCAPTAAAPSLPPTTGGPQPAPAPVATTEAPCGCQPAPQPARTPDPAPASTQAAPSPEPSSAPASSAPAASPSSSAAPKPTSSPAPLPVPVPTAPTPVPTLPVPLPTITPPAVPGISGAVPSAAPALPLR